MTSFRLAAGQSIYLNVVRYFLAMVVVIGHGFGFFFEYFGGFFPGKFPYPQSIAVVGFFYLSGFLIAGSLFQKDGQTKTTLGGYLFDRTTRIYLTLVPSLCFVFVADFLFRKFAGVSLDIVLNYSGFQYFSKNLLLVPSMPFGTMRPVWSLMYEWWIYLLFGGLVFFRTNWKLASLLIVSGFYYTVNVNGAGEAGHIWVIWFVGALCASMHRKVSFARWTTQALAAMSLLLFALTFVLYFLSGNAYDLFAGIVFSALIFTTTVLASRLDKHLFSFELPAKRLAGFSFTLFLTHYTVLTYVNIGLGLTRWHGFLIGVLASNAIAFMIAYCSEYRLGEIKSRLSSVGRSLRIC